MAKNFPYFKFAASEWLTGDIVFEPFSVQGLFINICALYWQRDGNLSIDDINRRYNNPSELPRLTDRFLSVNNGLITIKFLDEQLIYAGHISKVNSGNGSKGGRPKGAKTKENKPTAKRTKANESDEKQIRIRKEQELKKENNIEERKLKFASTLKPFSELYGREMLNEFYKYWTEPNKSGSKFKQELETTWSLDRRLETWAKNDKDFIKNKSISIKEVSPLNFSNNDRA